MSVLFIGKRFYTNRDALKERFGRMYQLPRLWSNTGVDTTLWLIDYHETKSYRLHDDALQVVSTPIRRPGWILTLLRLFGRALIFKKPLVVVASGDCYIGILAWLFSRSIRARFVFDVYDKYDEFGAYRRILGLDPFSFLLKRADRRLFASRSLMERLAWAVDQEDVLVPNGVSSDDFHPMDKLESRRILGFSDDISLVGYFGSMEPDRGIADLIEAVQILRAGGERIELLLGGRLHESAPVNLSGVRYLGNIPFHEMPRMLSVCDVLAIPYRRSSFMDSGASNKIAEALFAGRPIVVTRTPNFEKNFPKQAQQLDGRIAEPHNPGDLARVIAIQLRQPVYVDLPEGFDWPSIAAEAARKILFPAMTEKGAAS